MGKGKSHVNIKKSYEKKNQQTCKIQTIVQKFCKKRLSPLKNVVKLKVLNNKHSTHPQKYYTSCKTRVYIISLLLKK